jgi:hypothetical protein
MIDEIFCDVLSFIPAHSIFICTQHYLQLKEEEERQAKVLADLKIRRDQEEAFLADARTRRELEQIEADRQLRDIESRKIELEEVRLVHYFFHSPSEFDSHALL